MNRKELLLKDHLLVHPGEILKEEFMQPRGISVTELAKGLAMNRSNISNIINGHNGISAELAIKLSKAFGVSPEFWLNLQRNYDLRLASRKIEEVEIKDFSKMPQVA